MEAILIGDNSFKNADAFIHKSNLHESIINRFNQTTCIYYWRELLQQCGITFSFRSNTKLFSYS